MVLNLNEIQTNELINLIVKAGNEFYLNEKHGLNWTDNEYDKALDELKRRDPNFDIFKHLNNLNGKTVHHKVWFPAASKTKIGNVSWIVPQVTYKEMKQILSGNLTIPIILHYQNGRLKYVTTHINDENTFQISISDKLSVFPQHLQCQGNFRILATTNITDQGFDNVVIHFRLTETETNIVDWRDIRTALVKTEQFINFTLAPIDEEPIDSWKRINQARMYDQWWMNSIVPINIKLSPKMDGCSIVAYYFNSKLHSIISRSNDITGKIKTEYLRRYFPDQLPGYKNIAMMCEAVIDLGYNLDWNSRQQANGLINSKYKAADVSKLLNFVCYDAIDLDTNCRLDLEVLRKVIYDNNDTTLHQEEVNRKLIKMPTELRELITSNKSLFGHLCGVHHLPRIPESINEMAVTLHDLKDYPNEIIQVFNNKLLDELNLDDSMTNDTKFISAFEHGIYGSLRYASFIYDGECYCIFDKRDLNRPRLTTVDYFRLTDYPKFIGDCQAHYRHSDGGTYLIDGLAEHTYRKDIKRSKVQGKSEDTMYPYHNIYKWTFNEVAETEVESIEWNESPFGTLIPVIKFKTVRVEGSWLSKASSGGLARLAAMQCGPGSQIKVVRVNSTIPMIIQVLDPKPFKLPVCPHCGRQLTEHYDVYQTLGGAKILKCSDSKCIGKMKAREWLLETNQEFNLDTDIITVIGKLIPIEGYKPRQNATTEVYEVIKNSILNNDLVTFISYLKREVFVNMNADKLNTFKSNVESAFRTIRIKINKEVQAQ